MSWIQLLVSILSQRTSWDESSNVLLKTLSHFLFSQVSELLQEAEALITWVIPNNLSWLLTIVSTTVIILRLMYAYIYICIYNWIPNQNSAHVESTFSTLELSEAKRGGQTVKVHYLFEFALILIIIVVLLNGLIFSENYQKMTKNL